jgi:hypothetical protein
MFNSMTDSTIWNPHKKTHNSRNEVVIAYLGFAVIAAVAYLEIAKGEFSAVLTLSALFQLLAFTLLGIQVLSTKSAQGISAKTLTLDAIAIACRLSSTTWLNGYLPSDASGDFLYQAFDFCSLGMVLWLLYQMQGKAYDQSGDAFPAAPLAFGSLVLAMLFHGDLNDRPIFDALWMCGLFISAVSVLPQAFMMTQGHTSVAALTSHFVAVMAFSRVLSGTYMWHAAEDITCEPWIGDFNHVTWAIVVAHAVHLLLLGDFAYFYVKNVVNSGLQAPLELPEAWVV